jgi:choline-sulfatase
MDEQVGRIINALEESGELENTVIIFSSDHGLACGNHGLMGKQNMYEHSMRVPFIISGPGMPRNVKRDNPIYLQDVVATSLELAEAKVPEDLEFTSLLPLLGNRESFKNHSPIYGAYELELQRMVIADGYKLIAYPQAGILRLFHLESDPGEIHDLAGKPAEWPRIRRMFWQLTELQNKFEDPLDLAPYYPSLLSN